MIRNTISHAQQDRENIMKITNELNKSVPNYSKCIIVKEILCIEDYK